MKNDELISEDILVDFVAKNRAVLRGIRNNLRIVPTENDQTVDTFLDIYLIFSDDRNQILNSTEIIPCVTNLSRFYHRIYYFRRYMKVREKAIGYDPGINQQFLRLLEEFEQMNESEVDWSFVESLVGQADLKSG